MPPPPFFPSPANPLISSTTTQPQNPDPSSTTQALLAALVELRDTLSARVDQLGRSVERLRVEAEQLERNHDTGRPAEETTPLLPRINMDPPDRQDPISSADDDLALPELPSPISFTSPMALPLSPPRYVNGQSAFAGRPRLPDTPPRLLSGARPPHLSGIAALTNSDTTLFGADLDAFASSQVFNAGSVSDTESDSGSDGNSVHTFVGRSDAPAPPTTRSANTLATNMPVEPNGRVRQTPRRTPPDYNRVISELLHLTHRAHQLRTQAENRHAMPEQARAQWTLDLLELARHLRRTLLDLDRLEATLQVDSERSRAVRRHHGDARMHLVEAVLAANRSGRVPRPVARRIVEAMRGTETADEQVLMEEAAEEFRRANGIEPVPLRLRGCPPTNTHEVRYQPDPVVVRSIPASPTSTIKAEESSHVAAGAAMSSSTTTVEATMPSTTRPLQPARAGVNAAATTNTSDAEPAFGTMVAALLAAHHRRPQVDSNSSLTSRGITVENRIARNQPPSAEPAPTTRHRFAGHPMDMPLRQMVNGRLVFDPRSAQREEARDLRSLARDIVDVRNRLDSANARLRTARETPTVPPPPRSNVVVEVGVITSTRIDPAVPSSGQAVVPAPPQAPHRSVQSLRERRANPAITVISVSSPDELDTALDMMRRRRGLDQMNLDGDGPSPSSPTIPRSSAQAAINVTMEDGHLVFHDVEPSTTLTRRSAVRSDFAPDLTPERTASILSALGESMDLEEGLVGLLAPSQNAGEVAPEQSVTGPARTPMTASDNEPGAVFDRLMADRARRFLSRANSGPSIDNSRASAPWWLDENVNGGVDGGAQRPDNAVAAALVTEESASNAEAARAQHDQQRLARSAERRAARLERSTQLMDRSAELLRATRDRITSSDNLIRRSRDLRAELIGPITPTGGIGLTEAERFLNRELRHRRDRTRNTASTSNGTESQRVREPNLDIVLDSYEAAATGSELGNVRSRNPGRRGGDGADSRADSITQQARQRSARQERLDALDRVSDDDHEASGRTQGDDGFIDASIFNGELPGFPYNGQPERSVYTNEDAIDSTQEASADDGGRGNDILTGTGEARGGVTGIDHILGDETAMARLGYTRDTGVNSPRNHAEVTENARALAAAGSTARLASLPSNRQAAIDGAAARGMDEPKPTNQDDEEAPQSDQAPSQVEHLPFEIDGMQQFTDTKSGGKVKPEGTGSIFRYGYGGTGGGMRKAERLAQGRGRVYRSLVDL